MLDDNLPTEMPDEVATLWFLVRRVAAAVDRQGEALIRAELGISLAQFLVLSVIDAHPGPLSQQAVADRLGLTKGTVSRQIDAAASHGLVTVGVAAHTRRENALTLTAAGSDLVRRGDDVTRKSRDAMTRAVDVARLPAAVQLLRELADALDALDGSHG